MISVPHDHWFQTEAVHPPAATRKCRPARSRIGKFYSGGRAWIRTMDLVIISDAL